MGSSARGRRKGLSEREKSAQTSFDLPEPPLEGSRVQIQLKPLRYPIWTENKAKLIACYLRYFVFITKHGTYVDGFAGPQKMGRPEMWAAKLVVESEPRFLRNFYLCEIRRKSVEALRKLIDSQSARKKKEPKRSLQVVPGDFNTTVNAVLGAGLVTETEATFCLLDQRTFECEWKTVERLARHKAAGNKIELFYFLAASWFGRAFHETNDKDVIRKWWGREDWDTLDKLGDHERADLLCSRFRSELGYRHAHAWPIYTRRDGGRLKYHMVHASDHDEAPKLMYRAYHRALDQPEPPEQLDFLASLES